MKDVSSVGEIGDVAIAGGGPAALLRPEQLDVTGGDLGQVGQSPSDSLREREEELCVITVHSLNAHVYCDYRGSTDPE